MPVWVDWIAAIVSILGGIFAFLSWIQASRLRSELNHERERQAKKVRVVLVHGVRAIEMPVDLRRSELTRAEVQGRLGVLPMKRKGDRYSIAYLNTAEFLQRVREIGDGPGDSILTIPITQEEYDQFDLS